jgi:hypothetical protein
MVQRRMVQQLGTTAHSSGILRAYPGSVIYVRNANVLSVNFNAPVIQGVRPCVGQIGAVRGRSGLALKVLSDVGNEFSNM